MVGAPFMGHPVPILGHRVVVQPFSNPIGAVQNTPNHHKCPPLPLCPYLRPHTQVLACPVIAWASPQAGAEEVGPKHTNTMSVTHLSARIPTACLVRPPPSLHTHPASLRVQSTPCVHTHQRGVSRSPACTLTNLRVYPRGVCRSPACVHRICTPTSLHVPLFARTITSLPARPTPCTLTFLFGRADPGTL
jgi:hypothetical protein